MRNLYILYSTGCPKCKVLKAKLEQKGLAYTECNDVNTMEKLGIESLPVLEVEGKLLTFMEAVKFVDER